MTLYVDIEDALKRARERSAAKSTDEAYLRELLMISVGVHKTSGEVVHRPFYVAAKFLEQSRRDQTIKEADGAKFTGQAVPIQSLLDLQFALDGDLIIPATFQIFGGTVPTKGELKSSYEQALVTLAQFQPRGFY